MVRSFSYCLHFLGVLQVAVGEANDAMASLLNKYAGVYATGVDIQYGILLDNPILCFFE